MGVHSSIDYDKFPKQSIYLNKRVQVCFCYNTKNTISGTIVRDDYEDPWLTLIKLDDGRYVTSTECQYSPIC